MMNTAELIYSKAKVLPEAEAQEVLDFVEFLQSKRRGEEETAYLLRSPANARRLLASVENIREDYQVIPLEKTGELRDFALFLLNRAKAAKQPPARALGILQGKASCVIREDFSITDEELLRL